jgi:multisubunit Na+/H+ antiporter MnhB subunit
MVLQTLKEKWEDLPTRNWIIVFIIALVITFIGGAILINGAVYYADGNEDWKTGICKITNVSTQKIRWGHRAIFEVLSVDVGFSQ